MTVKEVLWRLTMQIMCRKFLNWRNVNTTPVQCFCAMSSANDTFITDTIKPSLRKIQHIEWDKHSSIILLLQLMIGSHDCENVVCWNRQYCSLHLHRYHTVWKLWVHKMPWHVELKGELKNYTVEMPARSACAEYSYTLWFTHMNHSSHRW